MAVKITKENAAEFLMAALIRADDAGSPMSSA